MRVAVLTDRFPELSETFVVNEIKQLRRRGVEVTVEANQRADRPAPLDDEIEIHYIEDDPWWGKPPALLGLAARRPHGVFRDRVGSGRWRREEPVRTLRGLAVRARRLSRAGVDHIHAHFAAGAALDAMRLAALIERPYSVTAHAFEIFASPANLREKLSRAAFATSGCNYNVRHLRELVGDEARDRIHLQVMGVDGRRFRRSTPYPGGRSLLAVGRLLEKKGFEDLVEAVGRLESESPVDRLTIVGDGPLAAKLGDRIRALGLNRRIELAGALEPEAVRRLMESSDALVMPCVIAADGDRDSMPVVVKEALAMELPVVGTDEVGLPELIHPQFGRLARPHDPASLASAVGELLAIDPAERAAMGGRGRAWVLERCDLGTETERLIGLIEDAVHSGHPAQVASNSR